VLQAESVQQPKRRIERAVRFVLWRDDVELVADGGVVAL
jgi:hypothetical protein